VHRPRHRIRVSLDHNRVCEVRDASMESTAAAACQWQHMQQLLQINLEAHEGELWPQTIRLSGLRSACCSRLLIPTQGQEFLGDSQ
jgi:hypothetical protein